MKSAARIVMLSSDYWLKGAKGTGQRFIISRSRLASKTSESESDLDVRVPPALQLEASSRPMVPRSAGDFSLASPSTVTLTPA